MMSKKIERAYVPVAILTGHAESMFQSEIQAMNKQADGGGDDNEPQSNLLQIYEGVGLISIKGKMVNTDSPWNRYFGLVS